MTNAASEHIAMIPRNIGFPVTPSKHIISSLPILYAVVEQDHILVFKFWPSNDCERHKLDLIFIDLIPEDSAFGRSKVGDRIISTNKSRYE